MTTLSDRLRAMHAARRLHVTQPGTGEQGYSVVATESRWADLLAAADALGVPGADDVELAEQQECSGCVFDRPAGCVYPGGKPGCGPDSLIYIRKEKSNA